MIPKARSHKSRLGDIRDGNPSVTVQAATIDHLDSDLTTNLLSQIDRNKFRNIIPRGISPMDLNPITILRIGRNDSNEVLFAIGFGWQSIVAGDPERKGVFSFERTASPSPGVAFGEPKTTPKGDFVFGYFVGLWMARGAEGTRFDGPRFMISTLSSHSIPSVDLRILIDGLGQPMLGRIGKGRFPKFDEQWR